jgi:hypothetical protein
MNAIVRNLGGTVVGNLADQPRLEVCVVVYLRLWANGQSGQFQIEDELFTVFGPIRGRHILRHWAKLIEMCRQFRLRPLMRRSVECPCLGSDEACFATFVATAAEGEREDAFLMATRLVRPDVAPTVTALATQVGLSLKQMLMSEPEPKSNANFAIH